MYKLVALIKRKPGLTKEEFRDYYETKHVQLGLKFLPPHCVKYSRRYLHPVVSPMKPGQGPAPDYDCITEFWFDNLEGYRAFEAAVAASPDVPLIVEDEENFVDRAQTHRFHFEECVSWEPQK